MPERNGWVDSIHLDVKKALDKASHNRHKET